MKQRLIWYAFLTILVILLLSACGPAPPADLSTTPASAPGESDTGPALEPASTTSPTPSTESQPEAYPPPQPAIPAEPTHSPDYPGPPTPWPTVDPYPGSLVWIIRPVGVQCEDGTTEGYGDLREAVSTLTAAGLSVADSELIELMVATVCGGPTSAHYRVQISVGDMDAALSMGWESEGT